MGAATPGRAPRGAQLGGDRGPLIRLHVEHHQVRLVGASARTQVAQQVVLHQQHHVQQEGREAQGQHHRGRLVGGPEQVGDALAQRVRPPAREEPPQGPHQQARGQRERAQHHPRLRPRTPSPPPRCAPAGRPGPTTVSPNAAAIPQRRRSRCRGSTSSNARRSTTSGETRRMDASGSRAKAAAVQMPTPSPAAGRAPGGRGPRGHREEVAQQGRQQRLQAQAGHRAREAAHGAQGRRLQRVHGQHRGPAGAQAAQHRGRVQLALHQHVGGAGHAPARPGAARSARPGPGSVPAARGCGPGRAPGPTPCAA